MIKKTDWAVKIEDTTIEFKERLFNSRDLTENDLNLTLSDMHDYIDIVDIDVAVFEIQMAVKKNKRILIFGDYDVDGTISTAELVKFFKSIKYPVSYHIPDRLTEGYGMSDSAVDKIVKEKNYDLIITVDNGIASISQINKLKEAGIDVIVTDHHECKEELPKANAVIDLKRPDSIYPFKELCGAGVVLKLIQALSFEFGLPEDSWEQYIEFTTIATIADVMPLIDENRIIVKEGLERIRKTKNRAILNLIRVCDKLDNISNISASDIGYYVAPLINASSRVGSVETVMKLLLTESDDEAIEYSDELKALNEKRKEIEKSITKEANDFIMKNYDFMSVNPLIVYGNNFHKGVIGIVASRLVEQYNRPVVIMSKDDDDNYHGSCRTYGKINIIEMLNYSKEFISHYGGHEGAAGLTIEEINLPYFIEKMNEYAKNNFSTDLFKPSLKADINILLKEITIDNIEYLETFAPFGNANIDPTFVSYGLKVNSIMKMGKKEGAINAHLKMILSDPSDRMGKTIVEAVGFFNSDYADMIKPNSIIDVMFKPSINVWESKKTPQMQIKDIHFNIYEQEGASCEENELYEEDELSITEIAEEYCQSIDSYIPSSEEYFSVYKVLSFLIKEKTNDTEIIITNLDILSVIVSAYLKKTYISPFKLARIIEANSEAGYFYYKKMLHGRICLSLKKENSPKRISETESYKKLETEKEIFNES